MSDFRSFTLTKPSIPENSSVIFDKLIFEVHAHFVPSKYIEYFTVHYNDGDTLVLEQSELANPIPHISRGKTNDASMAYDEVVDIDISVNTAVLEQDVNYMVDYILGEFV